MDCLELIDTTETQTVTSRKHLRQGQTELLSLAMLYAYHYYYSMTDQDKS